MRFLLGIILFLCLSTSLALPVHAQDNYVDGSYPEDLKAATEGDEMTAGGHASMLQGMFMADTVRRVLGPVEGVTVPIGTLQTDPEYASRMARGSAVAAVNNLILAMYTTQPADLAYFLRDTGQALGIIPKTAYAQGVGFSGLAPLLPIWKAFRNIAYLLLALVMVVIGFMVMLRKKIDPKTVVTVQNALPRIVITLLLVTFSYAIVGIVVDLMYVTILLTVGLLESANVLPAIDPQNVSVIFPGPGDRFGSNQVLYTQGGIFSALQNVFRNPTLLQKLQLDVNADTSIGGLVYKALGLNSLWARSVMVSGFVASLFLPPVVGLPAAGLFALPTIIALLVAAALLFLVIRLFIFFLGAYIQIILSLIFAPIQLLTEAVPGSSAFSSWFKNLIANVVVFPVGAVVFMLSAVFAHLSTQSGSRLWTPPYTPLFSASNTAVTALLSFGILFALPSIAGGIREALKAKPFVAAGPEGVVGALSQPGSAAMQMYQLWVSHSSMQAFRGIARLGGEEKKP